MLLIWNAILLLYGLSSLDIVDHSCFSGSWRMRSYILEGLHREDRREARFQGQMRVETQLPGICISEIFDSCENLRMCLCLLLNVMCPKYHSVFDILLDRSSSVSRYQPSRPN